jgi:hypothetical protein
MAEAMKADWGEVPVGKGSNVCWFSWDLMRFNGFVVGFSGVLMGFNCVLMGFTGLP